MARLVRGGRLCRIWRVRTRPGYLATWVRRGQEGGGKERRGARERLVMSGLLVMSGPSRVATRAAAAVSPKFAFS